MDEQWKILVEHIQALVNSDAAVINGLRNGPDVSKIKKNFKDNVKKLSDQVERFQMFIPDPVNQQIVLPFTSEKFANAWRDYKEFLLVVEIITLKPIEERYRLNRIYRLSDKNEEMAIELLDFFISNRYKSIFKPNTYSTNTEQPGEEVKEDLAFSTEAKTL